MTTCREGDVIREYEVEFYCKRCDYSWWAVVHWQNGMGFVVDGMELCEFCGAKGEEIH